MIELPASSLVFYDAAGHTFGCLRLVAHPEKPYAEGIFDVAPTNAVQAERPEVRWLCKRHYKRSSEHQLKIDEDGVMTIKKAGFKWTLEPDDGGGFTSQSPTHGIRAEWGDTEA